MSTEMTQAGFVILRQLLLGLFGSLVAKGFVGQDAVGTLADATTTLVIGLLGFLATAAWGLYRSRMAAKIADVAANPSVTSIHAEPALASSIPSDKVVASPPAGP